ncbi:hypothetical protein EHYA_07827 [Embleya hyalina]|uniref:Uncharacterized protein n=1 Tax=Embleya hyalina TaxID=516124 RepID=A0A401YZV8_9ACTN|nr:hypothetical protein EHYA_07827 [Embleya hyalina]
MANPYAPASSHRASPGPTGAECPDAAGAFAEPRSDAPGGARSAGVAWLVGGGWCGAGPGRWVGRWRWSGFRGLGLPARRASWSAKKRPAAAGREGARVSSPGVRSRVDRVVSACVARLVAGGWCGAGPGRWVGRWRRLGFRGLGFPVRRASWSAKKRPAAAGREGGRVGFAGRAFSSGSGLFRPALGFGLRVAGAGFVGVGGGPLAAFGVSRHGVPDGAGVLLGENRPAARAERAVGLGPPGSLSEWVGAFRLTMGVVQWACG